MVWVYIKQARKDPITLYRSVLEVGGPNLREFSKPNLLIPKWKHKSIIVQ